MSTCTLHNENCIPVLRRLPVGSVDCILTDPPYNLARFMKSRDTNLTAMRENFFGAAPWDDLEADAWVQSMDDFFREAARVVKPGGAVIVFMAIIKVETLIRLAQGHRLYYKTTGIWHKTNPMPRNMHLHFVNATEAWVYFINRKRTGTFNNEGTALHDFYECPVAPPSERKHGKHPTQKPVKLMEFFIRTLTLEGETVLDPFMGSGSTGVAAGKLNRNFIGAEIDKGYFDIAKERMK
ncbi:MAG: site-specific DNA-methyltransferase [Defluviitaleaceae bacterium]|nr:site-specific DNA-methyltransferase [Defluviitaleaceae bacterium]MCL2240733.1 site-specific DNA-methyltransferase [Defluviitaleaceae bacterium]